jgi:hypothetical protein
MATVAPPPPSVISQVTLVALCNVGFVMDQCGSNMTVAQTILVKVSKAKFEKKKCVEWFHC